jgi:hypothetical protein
MRSLYFNLVLFFALASGFAGTILHAQTQTSGVQVLMLDVCTYDPYYSEQIASTLIQIQPDVSVTNFTDESASLEQALVGKDIALVAYPHKGTGSRMSQYGSALQHFAAQGGVVVFTGTHEMSKINLFNLIQLEKGSYNPLPQVQVLKQVVFTKSLPSLFGSANYTYPVVVSEGQSFVNLATDQDRTVYGYRKLGKGLIFYVGLEFYHIEAVNKTILENLVQFVRTQKERNTSTLAQKKPAELPDVRNLAILPNQLVEWNVYPNPYVTRTQAEFIVSQPGTKVEASIFNAQGVLLARPILPTVYEQGRFAIEIPDLPYGTSFIQLRIGDQMSVKKITRVQAP